MMVFEVALSCRLLILLIMSARTTFHPQSHAPTDVGQFSEPKTRLVKMMEVFTTAGDRVNPTEEQLKLAQQLVQNGDTSRYTLVPFGSIIQHNQVTFVPCVCGMYNYK